MHCSSTLIRNFKLLALFCDYTGRFVSDLFGNHIVGFPTRWLKCMYKPRVREQTQVHFKGAIAKTAVWPIPFLINPYLTNGFSHRYQLDESTFIFRSDF